MKFTLDPLVAALRAEGCRVEVVEGASYRGVRKRGVLRPWDFVGQINHHDALTERVSDTRALELMRLGRSDLPGPLCNGWIDSDSTVYIVALGNANHAGYGEADVLERVKRDEPPLGDARSDPDVDSIVGNPHYWGWEVRNAGDGRDPYEQLDAMIRANAGLARLAGWTANRSIAHREHTRRKIDVAGIDMVEFRRLVANRLSSSPFSGPFPEGEDMHATFFALVADTYWRVANRAPDPKGHLLWVEQFENAAKQGPIHLAAEYQALVAGLKAEVDRANG